MTQSRRVFLVCHERWDRRWHRPLGRLRTWLARLLDSLVELTAADPEHARFALGGHSISVEDYAKGRRVDFRTRVENLARDRRLRLGPWQALTVALGGL